MRKSNVLIGANGAGLWHTLFTADDAVVVEVHWKRERRASPSLSPVAGPRVLLPEDDDVGGAGGQGDTPSAGGPGSEEQEGSGGVPEQYRNIARSVGKVRRQSHKYAPAAASAVLDSENA